MNEYTENCLLKMLSSMYYLKDGWYDGINGKAPSKNGIDWLILNIRYITDTGLHYSPYAYPTFDGNIQLEWSNSIKSEDIEEMDLSIEFDLSNNTANAHGTYCYKNAIVRKIVLNDKDGWKKLNKFISILLNRDMSLLDRFNSI